MTPQSVGLVRAERRLVEEFYNCPLHVNAGLILAPFLSGVFGISVSRWGVRLGYEICDLGKVPVIGCRPDAAEEDGTEGQNPLSTRVLPTHS